MGIRKKSGERPCLVRLSCFFFLLVCLFSFFTAPVRADNLAGTTVSICGDDAEWPPYIYLKRGVSGEQASIVGFSVDVVDEIFQVHGIQPSYRLLPWNRCLLEVENGTNYQILLNASYSEARAKKYHFSLGYYSLSMVYFYSANKYPDGLEISGVDQIKSNYKVCGVNGYNYEPSGFDSKEIDQEAIGYRELIDLLHKRTERCDLFIESIGVIDGFSMIGKSFLNDPNLKYGRIPGLKPQYFHMLVSKNFKQGEFLTKLIDKAIVKLEKSGRLEELSKKYLLEK